MKKKFTITIDPKVIEQIDEQRGLIPRSPYIEDCLKRRLSKLNLSKNNL